MLLSSKGAITYLLINNRVHSAVYRCMYSVYLHNYMVHNTITTYSCVYITYIMDYGNAPFCFKQGIHQQ